MSRSEGSHDELTALIEAHRWTDLRDRLDHLPAAEMVDLLRAIEDRQSPPRSRACSSCRCTSTAAATPARSISAPDAQ